MLYILRSEIPNIVQIQNAQVQSPEFKKFRVHSSEQLYRQIVAADLYVTWVIHTMEFAHSVVVRLNCLGAFFGIAER